MGSVHLQESSRIAECSFFFSLIPLATFWESLFLMFLLNNCSIDQGMLWSLSKWATCFSLVLQLYKLSIPCGDWLFPVITWSRFHVEIVTSVSYTHPKLQIAYKQTVYPLVSTNVHPVHPSDSKKKQRKKRRITFAGDDEPGWRGGVEQGFRPQVAFSSRGLSEDGRDHGVFLRP